MTCRPNFAVTLVSAAFLLAACESSGNGPSGSISNTRGVSDVAKFCDAARSLSDSPTNAQLNSALVALLATSTGSLHENILTLRDALATKRSGSGVEPAIETLVAAARSACGVAIDATGPEWAVTTNLSHIAVEQYIESNSNFGHPTGVICYGGEDIKVTTGKTFTCTASDGSMFHVEITKASDAEYVVTPGS